MKTDLQLVLLIDAENINGAEAVSSIIARARQKGTLHRAVAITPLNHPRMERLLRDEGIEILPRLDEMPANAADAILMMTAAEEACLARLDNRRLTYIFASNDNGFGGAAAMLRNAGHQCWRMGTAPNRGSAAGFDRVYCITPPPRPRPAPARTSMPPNLLPTSRMTLAAFGQHLKVNFPALWAKLHTICAHLSKALEKYAAAQSWPLVIERTGSTCCVVLADRH